MANSLDLTKLLPRQYRDKTLDSIIKNLFNRHVSKSDTSPLFGYIGDSEIDEGEILIQEKSLERQINQITSLIYAEHATEKKVFSWPDLVQKMVLLGVNYERIGEWLKTSSYNFVPPIDIDKFCNFSEYFWIGNWINPTVATSSPNLPYWKLGKRIDPYTIEGGFPSFAYMIGAFVSSNPSFKPEYYTIARGTIEERIEVNPATGKEEPVYAPVSPAPLRANSNGNLPTWTDWSFTNLWVHKDDIVEFLSQHGNMVSFSDLVQANRPIIEYSHKLRINTYQINGMPSEAGGYNPPRKIRSNQPPLFDLFLRDGSHSGYTSALFYYVEGSEYPVDQSVERRLAKDKNADFTFEHSLVTEDGEMLFFKMWDGDSFELKTIWENGPTHAPRYVKYDNSGTLINHDKFKNYRNYFWTGIGREDLPLYNRTGEPEYSVIEPGGDSDWSKHNYWVHVSQLKLSEVSLYPQAKRPIIEFNVNLEKELTSSKTALSQVPRFKMYAFSKGVDSYQRVPSNIPDLENVNDAYMSGALVACLDDLGAEMKHIFMNSPELRGMIFPVKVDGVDVYYVYGLSGVRFVDNRDGNVYGWKAETVSLLDPAKGKVVKAVTTAECVPEVITLTYDLTTNLFSVIGSVTGKHDDAIPGSESFANGVHFEVSNGSIQFEHGDTLVIDVKGFVYDHVQFHVKIGSDFRTLTSSDDLFEEGQQIVKTVSEPENRDGTWEVPPQLVWNPHNETRSRIKEGDLYFHFTSIIGAQPDIVGSETGSNNWRLLPNKNLGLGGVIKQFDGNFSLLVSMLIQDGITVSSIIEFARQSYEDLFNKIHSFVEDKIPHLLTDAKFSPPQSGDDIDQTVIDAFKEYFRNSSFPKRVFDDTTSPIDGLVPTLPYLGLSKKQLPRKELDLELNIPMMVHHDGHRSRLVPRDTDLLKAVVMKRFPRHLGQETPGFVTAVEFPADPHRGQFWFQTSTGKLFFYNVINDVGNLPQTAKMGEYVVDRIESKIWQWNGKWNELGSYEMNLPWTEVKLDLIEQNIILAIEKELFEKCPDISPRIDSATLETHPDYIRNMQKELERFGVVYGSPDVYSSAYSSSNAFTWNYSAIAPATTWNEIYRVVYGTTRPDLQPWIPAGVESEESLLQELRANGLISTGTTRWSPSLFTFGQVSDLLRQKYILNGKPPVLSVDTTSGALLPPYSVYAEGLYKEVPSSASDPFPFGSMGPVETFWTKTSNYLYSKQKTFFKIDPLSYLKKTWGVKYERIGGYELNSDYGRKESPSDFQLHGDKIHDLTALAATSFNASVRANITVTVLSKPVFDYQYVVKCVDRQDGIFEITRNGDVLGFKKISEEFSDEFISIRVSPKFNHFYWGDKFVIILSDQGQFTTSTSLQTIMRVEGLNQLYVQYRRLYGEDLGLSINQTLLKEWKIKSGYRFGGLVNTDSLVMKNHDDILDSSSYSVLIKENKFYQSSWLNALRIQLVQKGTVSNGGPRMGVSSPGEDWVFRVDNFNDARTDISWFKPDYNGKVNHFIALDGRRVKHNWNHFVEPSGVMTLRTPFLIRGIQNVVNFIFGYADKLEADGWRFNDQDNPVLDDLTGRPIGFQLLAEQFINQQYLNVDAGSSFVLNPFSRKVWFKTDHGVVSDLYSTLGTEQETVVTILDEQQRPIQKNELRVFRQDGITEIVFDRPCYTLHVLTSEYEHIAMFENYSVESVLLYDPFLGLRADKLFISGEKQSEFTGRLDLGGHFLLGEKMKKNIENSVENILKLYDSNGQVYQSSESERARALLGFKKKNYFSDRGSTDSTEFRFWQGMIANKGTNFSIDAYVNSSHYKSAKLDEYWAYKLADYGDAREVKKVEMRVTPDDCSTENANYLFLESDELRLIKIWKRNAGFDVANLGITAYDVATLYTEDQSRGFDYVDPNGCVIIRPDDDSRWHRFSDLRSMEYFEASPIAEYRLVAKSIDDIYVITDSRGDPVRADVFEIFDPEFEYTYYEMGEFSNSAPFDMDEFEGSAFDFTVRSLDNDLMEYDPPSFVRLNHCTIQITNPSLIGKPLKVIAYGPAHAKYSPLSLIDYRNNVTTVDDAIWWDPARGVHHPEAINQVDIVSKRDPARYNRSLLTAKNSAVELIRPWGDEQVGRIWWNTKNLSYQPYSDTKVVPDVNDRLARWGSISDSSSIEVYEWHKSSVSPDEFVKTDNDGDIAVKNVLTRKRTWFHRTVAWKYAENPLTSQREFLAYQPSRMYVEVSGKSGTAILNSGDFFDDYKMKRGTKIAAAFYSQTDKQDINLTKLDGTIEIVSDVMPVVGNASDYNGGAKFMDSPYFKIRATVDTRMLTYKENMLGQFKLTHEQDANDFYVRLTHVQSGMTQKIRVRDIPVLSGTQDTYVFDQFGVSINCTSLVSRSNLVGSSEFSRSQHAAMAIGNPDHEIYLRSKVDVYVTVPFANFDPEFYLDGNSDISRNGWVAWNDPEVNPNEDFAPPLNRWMPVVGEWQQIGGRLADLAANIKKRAADPWVWFDGTDYSPYKHVWSNWEKLDNTVVELRYNPGSLPHEEYMKKNFVFDLTEKHLRERGSLYINEMEVRASQWTPRTRMNGPFIIGSYPGVEAGLFSLGDSVKAIIRPDSISEEDLRFDPEIADDMYKLVQFKIDYPHVFEEKRDENDRFSTKHYYFWVKNKQAPSKIKQMSVAKVSDLLHWHDGTYAVPQIFKQYNQLDGRPNRYAMLSLKNLGNFVRQSDMYKLRITNNPTLRNSDNNLDLKNRHTEWVLIRPSQPTRVPKQLWDKMVDTIVGHDATQSLPFAAFENYDTRNGTNDRYGFGDGQIISDPRTLLDTVKYTILNTRVDKYEGNERVADEISFSGFESASTDEQQEERIRILNENLSFIDENDVNGVMIRKFMSDIWRFAKPKQINEIFFAVLEDAAEKNLEMNEFFKTSFISLGEIRTVQDAN